MLVQCWFTDHTNIVLPSVSQRISIANVGSGHFWRKKEAGHATSATKISQVGCSIVLYPNSSNGTFIECREFSLSNSDTSRTFYHVLLLIPKNWLLKGTTNWAPYFASSAQPMPWASETWIWNMNRKCGDIKQKVCKKLGRYENYAYLCTAFPNTLSVTTASRQGQDGQERLSSAHIFAGNN